MLVNAEMKARFPLIEAVLVDRAYNGTFLKHVHNTCPGVRVEIVKHDDQDEARLVLLNPDEPLPRRKKGFRVLRLRWVVERTFAWLGLNRRLSKDYEANISSSQTWIWMAMARLLLRRLTK